MNSPIRHSRAGGNPDHSSRSRVAGQNQDFVRYAENLFLLDSRLRGNDNWLTKSLP